MSVVIKCDNESCASTVSPYSYVKEQTKVEGAVKVLIFCCYVCCRDYHEG